MSDNDIELDYSDISSILKNNLKIENTLKSISSIFNNKRFSQKINYKPYFQRNYVWDESKATYFIESVLIGTEIPPLVLFNNHYKNEVIDGRQRYETIERFLTNKITLKEDGLKSLKGLAGKRFVDLSDEDKERFEEIKLRILQYSVVNEPTLEEDKEDKIKKEIFRRYNSGIIPLKKEEINRAEFIDDPITLALNNLLKNKQSLYESVSKIFLPKSQNKAQKRDRLNILVTRIRRLITLPLIPIRNYAHSSYKNDVISVYYNKRIATKDTDAILKEFEIIMSYVSKLKKILSKNANKFFDSGLLYECCYWIFSILYSNYRLTFEKIDLEKFSIDLENSNEIEFFWNDIDIPSRDSVEIFETSGSHYYKSILNRYTFIANYFSAEYSIHLENYLRNSNDFNKIMNEKLDINDEIKHFRLNKTDPTSMTIEDIMQKIKKSKFLIRPSYQRSEVTNPIKSAYLMESIILGIKVPPIFIYKRQDKVSEVVDGQQRLLSIIGFLGQSYLNEEGNEETSQKNMYKLKGLKILDELNEGDSKSIDAKFIDKILDFQLDVVEIDAEQNPHFNNIDLFLRLNTKPYPIKPNTFELWNAYVDKDIIMSIRKISNEYSGKIFRAQDTRMRNEELITSLAYMDYKRKLTGNELRSVLTVYIRSGRVSARIKEKADITKILSDITNKDATVFEESVEKVLVFIDKINKLTDNDNSLINVIFSHKSKSNSSRTDQNFYFLWILLDKISESYIMENKHTLIKKITAVYQMIQKAPTDFTINDLYNIIDNFHS
ncbi:DUF262 domain-containing protein [Paenibacillus sp. P13VS]|uniref:DUF262 domain-containing protein n=1 Tax=Paenibacillus sp. P13VS TaxID=2697367 RepID=UPI00187B72B0|nr:DUF262 domain-containing protein [Paenibacillus sp. P13VS]MBE7681498.1 DUF262 domain-containing protein [Paenibacillus sp. P13VS]